MAQKWYEKASVQTAMVGGIFSILIARLYIGNDRSQLKRDNKN